VQHAKTYLSLFVGQVSEAERFYAAIAVPALVDPALHVPGVVVVAAPRSAGDAICGMRLPRTHGQTRQAVGEVVRVTLRLEQLRKQVAREAAFR
jgi:hypothetical protein